jgi:hypothetical protein
VVEVEVFIENDKLVIRKKDSCDWLIFQSLVLVGFCSPKLTLNLVGRKS